MLGKLLKYEFKATSRYFMFLYSAVIGLAIINKIFWLIETENIVINAIRGFITGAFIIVIVATVIFSIVIIIFRFYKNLLSDEGYLSFTLPVTATKHILSKILVGVMWIIVTVLVIIAALLIMAINTGFYSAFPDAWNLMKQFFEVNPELLKFVVEMFVIIFVAMFTGTLMFFAAMSIGHLFSKHRVIASIISFFAIYFGVQTLNTIVLGVTMAAGFGSKAFESLNTNPEIQISGMNSLDISSAFVGSSSLTYTSFLDMISAIFIVSVVMQIVLGVVYFLVTRYILKKKLNLD